MMTSKFAQGQIVTWHNHEGLWKITRVVPQTQCIDYGHLQVVGFAYTVEQAGVYRSAIAKDLTLHPSTFS